MKSREVFQAVVLLVFSAVLAVGRAEALDPPPTDGSRVVKEYYRDYALYQPPRNVAEDLPKPLPVVVYVHGSFDNNPDTYDAILSDMAEAGYVVVFPTYSKEPSEMHQWYQDLVLKTLFALGDIYTGNVGYVEASIFDLAIAGHSVGGMYSLKLATHPWIPDPKAVILHDAGGFGVYLPLSTPEPFNPYWLDSIRLADDTRLVVLMGMNTLQWQFEEHFDWDTVELGNSIMSGVWSRAWWLTGLPADHKHALLIEGRHLEIQGGRHYAAYRDATINALDAAFRADVQFDNNPSQATDVRSLMNLIWPKPWSTYSARDEADWVLRLIEGSLDSME